MLRNQSLRDKLQETLPNVTLNFHAAATAQIRALQDKLYSAIAPSQLTI